jgi:hypothetical protein
VPRTGNWWPCTKDYPDAQEDLNRWTIFTMTGSDPFANVHRLGMPDFRKQTEV